MLVKDKTGEPVLSLNAGDFILTDNGVPQSVRMELDTDSQPMALAVIVETGREGALHLGDYRNLGVALDAVIGNVPRHIAVIGFDSSLTSKRTLRTIPMRRRRPSQSCREVMRARRFSMRSISASASCAISRQPIVARCCYSARL